MATTSKFMISGLCSGTNPDGIRARAALKRQELFPLIVDVRIVGDPDGCLKCGQKRYKMTTESQVNTERLFGFETSSTRWVCESMGGLVK